MTKGNEAAFASVAVSVHGGTFGQDGLTKREYFAAMALSGLCANPHLVMGDATKEFWIRLGNGASHAADALIDALNKTGD